MRVEIRHQASAAVFNFENFCEAKILAYLLSFLAALRNDISSISKN